MNAKLLGTGLFVGAAIVFLLYCLIIYIPAAQSDPGNAEAFLAAIFIGVVCGAVGTIGAFLYRK